MATDSRDPEARPASAQEIQEPLLQKPRGAPKKAEAQKTRTRWEGMGSPKILNAGVCDELAQHSYPDEFAKAPLRLPLRKRLRDRVAQQVKRLMKKGRPAT